jgi:diguanylate cyclase (GGDEF)-like protein/PAS domain S-box-containing protein
MQATIDFDPNLFRVLIDQSNDAVVMLDEELNLAYWNAAFQGMFHSHPVQIEKRNICDYLHPRYADQFRTDFQTTISQRKSFTGLVPKEIIARNDDGTDFWVEFSFTKVGLDNQTWTFVVLRDVRERKRHEHELRREAITDFLSGLHNRRQFQRTLEQNRPNRFCLAIIDVDNFKSINDSFGHLVGDQAIRFVAENLVRYFHDAECVARLGGEEFGVVFSCESPTAARGRLDEFRDCISRTGFSENNHRITVSAGATFSSSRNFDLHRLMDLADQALYRSKAAGRDCVTFSEE